MKNKLNEKTKLLLASLVPVGIVLLTLVTCLIVLHTFTRNTEKDSIKILNNSTYKITLDSEMKSKDGSFVLSKNSEIGIKFTETKNNPSAMNIICQSKKYYTVNLEIKDSNQRKLATNILSISKLHRRNTYEINFRVYEKEFNYILIIDDNYLGLLGNSYYKLTKINVSNK